MSGALTIPKHSPDEFDKLSQGYPHQNHRIADACHCEGALYTGVTNSLYGRVWQHKQSTGSQFTTCYKLDRLVYSSVSPISAAQSIEKRIKGWLRIKKIALIVSINPTWRDLSDGSYERHRYHPEQCIGPSLRSG